MDFAKAQGIASQDIAEQAETIRVSQIQFCQSWARSLIYRGVAAAAVIGGGTCAVGGAGFMHFYMHWF
jgi:hypothetical protein